MNDKKGTQLAIWLSVVAFMLVAATAYTGAYFSLGKKTGRSTTGTGTFRLYSSPWVALCFIPASLVESAVSGGEVKPAWTSH